jgi:hypothetical protein
MSPESAASKKLLLLTTDLENCPGFASNKDVAFPFLRLRSSNCATTQKKAHGTPSLTKSRAPLAEFYGGVRLIKYQQIGIDDRRIAF